VLSTKPHISRCCFLLLAAVVVASKKIIKAKDALPWLAPLSLPSFLPDVVVISSRLNRSLLSVEAMTLLFDWFACLYHFSKEIFLMGSNRQALAAGFFCFKRTFFQCSWFVLKNPLFFSKNLSCDTSSGFRHNSSAGSLL